MADAFQVLGSERQIERLGPARTRPVWIVTCLAKESGVVYWLKVLPTNYNTAYIAQRGGVVAEEMNTLAAKPGVLGVRVLEDTDPSDRLIQVVVVTVESSSGDSTDDVTLSWTEAQGVAGYTKVAATRKHLDAIEAI